jgi:glycerol kinase
MSSYILSIDQGTSSTKTLIFDASGAAVAKGTEPLLTHYLPNGFVEQDPHEILKNVRASVAQCLDAFEAKGFSKKDITAIGISNQRETFIVWDSAGKPLYNAVVWQCKRSVDICNDYIQKGFSEIVTSKTGLLIDPYFSATKLMWLQQNVPSVAAAIKNGAAYFGTVDTWLLYQLTNGASYATDITNASRTLLFNLEQKNWDDALIADFGLTGIQLPTIQASASMFGTTNLFDLLDHPIAITAMIGDSHAAAFGEGCFEKGTAKATLGTGCSLLMHVGDKPVASNNGMVSTVCWSTENQTSYALEGVIVSCGSTIEWLKNDVGLFTDSKETESMALSVPDNNGVYIVPAFSGMGSPHWQMNRRASIEGLTFSATKHHIVRAALESITYQIADVIVAMEKDANTDLVSLQVDGGISGNSFVVQWLSDVLQKEVHTIGMPDISALGAAYLAGLKAGVFENIEALKKLNNLTKTYTPNANNMAAKEGYEGWQEIINKYEK